MSDKELVDERQSRRPERHGHGDQSHCSGPLDVKPIRYRRKRNDTAQEEFGERAGRNDRGPSRSAIGPKNGARPPPEIAPAVTAAAVSARLQPSSSLIARAQL